MGLAEFLLKHTEGGIHLGNLTIEEVMSILDELAEEDQHSLFSIRVFHDSSGLIERVDLRCEEYSQLTVADFNLVKEGA